ncbi:hypothetical protein IVB02_21335 [Bradyrhizobium sp. 166]|uniref:hypothetical protein n=1 Tax=Bradyrhizobium sp. 166 TaxID=2782638 RepID=UPI001FF7F208|nr:hypothetical protein [Bradyrhizobium sp. 166]MCK1603910.1 hypothetical protein [Bradyrhizobium sp. 166]
MTAALTKWFAIRDAASAAGGVLSDLARAMDDAVVSGIPVEQAIGCFGRWRVEGRQILARRRVVAAAPAAGDARRGDYSACARGLQARLSEYAASRYLQDRAAGIAPEGVSAELFRILEESNGRVPALRTLRRRFS